MRIAQVSPWFYPHLGGVESHVFSLSAQLAKRGHDITVVTSLHDGAPEKEEMLGFRIIRVKPLTVALRTPVTPRMKSVLMNLGVDLIHAHSPPPLSSYYGSRVAKRKSVPFIVTYHCDIEIGTPFGSLLSGIYARTFGNLTIRRASRIIVTSRTYAATSRAIWSYSPEIIPNAVDGDLFNPGVDGTRVKRRHGIGDEEKVILHVGRVVPHKGIEHLVEATKYVDDARLLIVGEGSFLSSIRRLVRDLDLGGKVVLAGRVPREQLPQYYAACDLFVLPSVSRLEAFGIVALEAMATGKPVVVTDIPGVREVITDGREGLLCDPVNPKDLTEKINYVLANDELRQIMGRRAREKVESEFAIEKVSERIEKVYESVLSQVDPSPL